ncbi:MAG TPA: hypothetical protein VGN57_03495 [Pirellulaceae bacterium]|jgi:hypothetical protein|nr:hypothetical protein [Pirellulaceae bacterium]
MFQALLAHATSTEWSAIGIAFAAGSVVGALATGGLAVGARYLGGRPAVVRVFRR